MYDPFVKSDKPDEIIHGTGKHRVDTHIFPRRIHESWCAQKGCKFYGKPAVQGVCHTTTSFAGDDFSYWEHLDALVGDHLKVMRKMHAKLSTAERIRRLESELACGLMNAWSGLDECIRLRRDNALLRDQVERLKKKRA